VAAFIFLLTDELSTTLLSMLAFQSVIVQARTIIGLTRALYIIKA
jgi:hypothetical protein